jgi:hypothetical protein
MSHTVAAIVGASSLLSLHNIIVIVIVGVVAFVVVVVVSVHFSSWCQGTDVLCGDTVWSIPVRF